MAKKAYFEPPDVKVDFPALERTLLEYWYQKGIVKKYLEKNKNSKKYFSFLDGPITANNPMGIHHAWGRTYKDLWQRFKNMQGFKQRFQNGFDCQGLWVEVEVEKELGLKSKKDIENLVEGNLKESIAKFIELCKGRVRRFAGIQTEQSKRLGYFMDWDHSYFTLSDENNYMIWHFLKKCHEKGLIYKGHDSVPWCPRCGTAISQHEMLTEDYKEATHDSVYVQYPIVGRKNEYLLVWTTTPWTLPGNVAVAIASDRDYVVAGGQVKGNTYYLNEYAAKRLNLKIEKKIKGKELVGLKYISPFDGLSGIKKALGKYEHEVVATDEKILPVSEEEGTGLVHVAPGAGSEDYKLGKKLDLPVIELVDEEAAYISDLGEFSGKNAKKHPEIILDYLKENPEYLFDIVPYTHRYPACWRCKTELVWRVVDEWYIAMEPLREPLKKVTQKINWLPKFGLKREIDWLDNMHDWLISKKRYWGLALPIWECSQCGHFEVIGSKDELREKALEGWEKFDGNSPHRPWVDEVKIKCEKCGKKMQRIPDVGNPWLDAGIVPFSTVSTDNKSEPLYWKDKGEWEKWYPADFITESFPGQFKNWFYSLLAMSTVLENSEPFKTVLGFATLLGEDGRPMHKSWGNSIEFNEGADKIGVDVMRWMYVRQDPSLNLLFGYKVADETRRKFHLKLWNVYNFFVTYANLDGWKPQDGFKLDDLKLTPLDHWILSRLNGTIKEVTDFLEKYDAYSASAEIESFVDDLSLWYIRRSRDRVGPGAENEKDKNIFYGVTYFVLTSFSRLLAPFNPFMAEEIYRNLTKEESVHLSDWPDYPDKVDTKLVAEMARIRQVVEKAHAERKEKKIPVRQPLSLYQTTAQKPVNDLEVYVKDEINVKAVAWATKKDELDTKITPELEEEAKARELIRKIQEERRNLGMNLTQRISVSSPWLPMDTKLVQRIKIKTLAENLAKGEFKLTPL
ncbi:MAG: Isoleucyl-tRNA synthetase [Candidatus Woesebacteria bacterium GW2011_GWE1_45_18]|uniref:Isoleucine--tRNA ligase n=1 Tax=Candidatus Woesebacteria bacterium GW2011_GWE1_45_18 TaxID=1618598 RepID=A0A0G1M3Q6_9BACT|nr:MAG: Isoleucyl-tRNA synthetase [Candidatus Woesebacteria bacterium GW2011_GWE1_45_18]